MTTLAAAQQQPRRITLEASIDLTNLIHQIDEFRDAEESWQEEGTVGVSIDTGSAAIGLLQELANRSTELGVEWIDPDISPDPQGRLHLLWEKADRRTLLIVAPNPGLIGKSIRTAKSGKPEMQPVTKNTAIEHVFWTLIGT